MALRGKWVFSAITPFPPSLPPAPAHCERWDLRPGHGPLPLRERQRRERRDHVHPVVAELRRDRLSAESRAAHVRRELLQGQCMKSSDYRKEFTQKSLHCPSCHTPNSFTTRCVRHFLRSCSWGTGGRSSSRWSCSTQRRRTQTSPWRPR